MKFQKDITLLSHTLQTAIIGLFNEANDNHNLLSHILLILKYYILISREKRTLKINILIANLMKVRKREKQISICTISRREAYKKVVHCRYIFASILIIHRGWMGRGFFVCFICLYAFLLFACMLFYIYLFISVIVVDCTLV